MFLSNIAAAALLSLTFADPWVLASEPAAPAPFTCEGKVSVSTTFIGQDKNVLAETFQCANPVRRAEPPASELVARQSNPTNICGAQCNTNCFNPAGGGPDPNDCHVIADALLFDSQNIGNEFVINPASSSNSSVLVLTFRSCETFMVNQASVPLTYCRLDWSPIVDFVATNCQATQNAHGGNCVAQDQRWFIQIQTAPPLP